MEKYRKKLEIFIKIILEKVLEKGSCVVYNGFKW